MSRKMDCCFVLPFLPRLYGSALGQQQFGEQLSARSLSAPSSDRPDYDTFGGSLCTSSGHSSSTSSRISSETSVRPSVSSRNLCSRSKSSCTMMWSEIIRGAKIRFDFTFSVLPLFVLFSWRTNHLSSSASDPQLARFVIGRVFLSHEETSEIPLSSSIVLRRFPPISDERERTRSIW